MKLKVKVGKVEVEVRNGTSSIFWFKSGERGKKEAGPYAFWTAMFAKPVPAGKGKKRRIIGRAAVGLSAGDRFDRMERERREAKNPEDRKVYERFWTKYIRAGRNIKYIRPSTPHEIKLWASGHESDFKYARRMK